MTGFVLRAAALDDLPAIQAIYAHHVLHGLGTFEETPPSLEEMTRRWRSLVEAGMPYLVAVDAGTVMGYAYAGLYRPRPAYRYSVEDSVYVAPDAARRGYGRRLVAALIEQCAAKGFRQMLAVIGDRDNHGSVGLHRNLGFKEVGLLSSVGFKFGRWVDVVVMQRPLGDGDATQDARRLRRAG
jgi:L-amino acid N-acyltransferase YncA